MMWHTRKIASLRCGLVLALSLPLSACYGSPEKPAPDQQAGVSEAKPSPDTNQSGDVVPSLPAAESLLAKAAEAAGGRDKFEAIDSFYQEVTVTIGGQNITGDVKVWWKKGDFYTESNITGIGIVKAGKRGDEIWAQDPINGLRELSGIEAEQAAWGSSLSLVADWQDHFAKAETTGERVVDGKKVYDVKLTSKSGDELVMTFDAESGLQLEQSFKQTSPMGATPVKTKFEDFREVAGIQMAFRQSTDASLARVTQAITKIDVNVPVDEGKFAMPRGGAAVVKIGPEGAESSETEPKMMPFGPDGKPGRPVPEKPAGR